MIPLDQYNKIRNNLCLYYPDFSGEYVMQILCLRPYIERELQGLQLFVCCRDELMYLSEWYDKILSMSQLEERKSEFAYIRQLTCNMFDHPVLELLEESEIPFFDVRVPSPDLTMKCVIAPEGNLPTKCLTEDQIERAKTTAINQGYRVEVSYDIEGAGWVIGVENEQLFLAASRGIPTSLVPTGVGTRLYQKMFPKGEILDL